VSKSALMDKQKSFVAIERNTKLVLNFAPGKRNQVTTDIFLEGLRHATSRQRFQITTNGFAPYRSAIVNTFEDRADFAQLIKVYPATPEGERRYGPAEIVSTEVDMERQDLTMRMQIRRLTRLTNGFSRKWENLWAALSLALRLLQLLPRPQESSRHSCNAGRNH